jgi:hypothetical protein
MITSIGTGMENVICFGKSLLYGRTLRSENFHNQFLVRLIYPSYQHLKAIDCEVLLKPRDNCYVLNSSSVLIVMFHLFIFGNGG